MSRVHLGLATRCARAVAPALALLCYAAPPLAQSSPPMARMSRACPYATTSVWGASTAELRAAVVCLINDARERRGLPRLHEQGQLDAASQSHSDAMVARDFFGHGDPASRISSAGFNWGAYGEVISTGYSTPWHAFWGWMSSSEHCQILLSPTYKFIGVGIDPRGVSGWTGESGTWTADVALPLGWRSPSGDWGPANHC